MIRYSIEIKQVIHILNLMEVIDFFEKPIIFCGNII